jgi:hypothetical protein
MKFPQKTLGYILVGLGAASVFVGASPLFVIKFEAIIVGFVLFIAGAWVLAGRELRDTIRKAYRATRDARRRGGDRSRERPVPIDPLLPVEILKLAKIHAGVLTVAQAAMELNVPLDQAQAAMDQCVRAGNAIPDFDIPHGHSLYRFPEFFPPENNRLSS